MIARLPGIVTFRFRELLPPLHQLSHAKGRNLRVLLDFKKIASEFLHFYKKQIENDSHRSMVNKKSCIQIN